MDGEAQDAGDFEEGFEGGIHFAAFDLLVVTDRNIGVVSDILLSQAFRLTQALDRHPDFSGVFLEMLLCHTSIVRQKALCTPRDTTHAIY